MLYCKRWLKATARPLPSNDQYVFLTKTKEGVGDVNVGWLSGFSLSESIFPIEKTRTAWARLAL